MGLQTYRQKRQFDITAEPRGRKSRKKGSLYVVIFVDYLRNGRGATAVVAYSSRARKGAPVSTPVAWSELGPALPSDRYAVINLSQRLAHLRKDPWADIGRIKQELPDLGNSKKTWALSPRGRSTTRLGSRRRCPIRSTSRHRS